MSLGSTWNMSLSKNERAILVKKLNFLY